MANAALWTKAEQEQMKLHLSQSASFECHHEDGAIFGYNDEMRRILATVEAQMEWLEKAADELELQRCHDEKCPSHGAGMATVLSIRALLAALEGK